LERMRIGFVPLRLMGPAAVAIGRIAARPHAAPVAAVHADLAAPPSPGVFANLNPPDRAGRPSGH